jgi:hypothetical protein
MNSRNSSGGVGTTAATTATMVSRVAGGMCATAVAS